MTLPKIEPIMYRTLVIGDFLTGNVTLNKDKKGDEIGFADIDNYTKIGTYTVPASTMIAIGLPQGGLFYIALYDSTPTLIHGQALIKVTNPERTKMRKVASQNTRTLDPNNKANRITQPLIVLGQNVPIVWALQDSKIELWFKPETNNVTVDSTKNNELLLECISTVMPHNLRR
jgi:hypothetical protein